LTLAAVKTKRRLSLVKPILSKTRLSLNSCMVIRITSVVGTAVMTTLRVKRTMICPEMKILTSSQ
jgi:hypothetical protein